MAVNLSPFADEIIRDLRNIDVPHKDINPEQLNAMWCLNIGSRYQMGANQLLIRAIQQTFSGSDTGEIIVRTDPIELIVMLELLKGYTPRNDGRKRFMHVGLRTNSTRLSQWLNCDQRKVKDALVGLEERGFIHKSHKGGDSVEVTINWKYLWKRMIKYARIFESAEQNKKYRKCEPSAPWILNPTPEIEDE